LLYLDNFIVEVSVSYLVGRDFSKFVYSCDLFVLDLEIYLHCSSMVRLRVDTPARASKNLQSVLHIRSQKKSSWMDLQLGKDFNLEDFGRDPNDITSGLGTVLESEGRGLVVSWFESFGNEGPFVLWISFGLEASLSLLGNLDLNMEVHMIVLIKIELISIKVKGSHIQSH